MTSRLLGVSAVDVPVRVGCRSTISFKLIAFCLIFQLRLEYWMLMSSRSMGVEGKHVHTVLLGEL